MSTSLLRYLEELDSQEQKDKKEADRLAAQKVRDKKRLAKQQAEEERIAHEKVETERKAKEEVDRLAAQKAEIEQLEKQKVEEDRIAHEKVQTQRKAKEKADFLAAQKAEEERLAQAKVEAERKAKEEAERSLAEQKAEEERKAKQKNEHLATQKFAENGLAREKAEEHRAKEEAERLLPEQKADKERIANANIETERKVAEKAERDAAEMAIRKKADHQASTAKKPNRIFLSQITNAWMKVSPRKRFLTVGGVAFFVLLAFLVAFIIALTPRILSEMPKQPVQFVLPGKSPSFSLLNPNVHYVLQVAFSPDGRLLASAGSEGIQLWNVRDGTLIKKIDQGNAVSFSPDGKLLAYSTMTIYPGPSEIKLWRISDELYLESLQAHTEANNEDVVSDFVFSPDSKLIASTSRDNTVRLWDIGNGSLLRMFEGQTNVEFSPDGQILASTSSDNTTNTISLWKVSDGTLIKEFNYETVYTGNPNSLAFSPDGQILASASNDGIILWDLSNGTKIKALDVSNTLCIAFSPDGQKLASSGYNKTVLVWGISDGVSLNRFEGHKDFVYSVIFSPDGTLLASGSDDGTIRLWAITP